MKNLRAAYGKQKTGEKKGNAVQLNTNINAPVEKRGLGVYLTNIKNENRNPLTQLDCVRGFCSMRLFKDYKIRRLNTLDFYVAAQYIRIRIRRFAKEAFVVGLYGEQSGVNPRQHA